MQEVKSQAMKPSAASPVPFKVQLQRKDSSVYHRFSGAFKYEEFISIVSHLWGTAPNRIVLEYVDDEGDRVRLSNEMEWSECIRIYLRNSGAGQSAAPIRIVAQKHKEKEDEKKHKSHQKRDHRGVSEGRTIDLHDGNRAAKTSEEAEAEEAASLRAVDDDENCDSASTPAAVAATAGSIHGTPRDSGRDSANSKTSKSRAVQLFDCNSQEAEVMNLLEAVFGSNAAERLMSESPLTSGVFGSIVRRTPSQHDPEEVHIDIDLPLLFHHVSRQANVALDSHRYAEAEKILRAALKVFADNKVFEYNLSCALSLQGKLQEAFDALVLATRHGYDNVTHILEDPDLENLRAFPAFQSCGFAAVSKTAPTPTSVNPLAVISKPDAPAAVPPTSNEMEKVSVSSEKPRATEEPPVISNPAPAGSPSSAEGGASSTSSDPAQNASSAAAISTATPPVPTVQSSTTPAMTTVQSTTTSAPQSTTNGYPKDIQTILSIFPSLTYPEAVVALRRANGNVTVAVNNLLTGGI